MCIANPTTSVVTNLLINFSEHCPFSAKHKTGTQRTNFYRKNSQKVIFIQVEKTRFRIFSKCPKVWFFGKSIFPYDSKLGTLLLERKTEKKAQLKREMKKIARGLICDFFPVCLGEHEKFLLQQSSRWI